MAAYTGLAVVLTLIPNETARGQIFRLPPPDTTSGNYFGSAVGVDGKVAIVGASGDAGCGENSGAAYVYELGLDGEWSESARLEPSDCQEGLFFGKAVAVSGRRVVVTAYLPFFSKAASNSVYVFEKEPDSGKWVQTDLIRRMTEEDEGPFAASVALSGERILITTAGDTSRGSFGGAAYVYEYDGSSWIAAARLTPSLGTARGVFGTSAALDGDLAVVSASTYLARKPGSVYVFELAPDSGSWIESAVLAGIRDFFISVDVDGDRILVGESKGGTRNTGRARIFEKDGDGRWVAVASLAPPARFSKGGFGSLVSIKGDHALIVGFDEQLEFEFNIDRVVYLFERRRSGRWLQKHIIDVGDVSFGSAIDLNSGEAIVGQASDRQPGQAYVVTIR